MSAQILVLPSGRLVWASVPYPGSMHDVAALDASGLLDGIDTSGWIADKGYIGTRRRPVDAQGLGRTHPLTPTRRLKHHVHADNPNPPRPLQLPNEITIWGIL